MKLKKWFLIVGVVLSIIVFLVVCGKVDKEVDVLIIFLYVYVVDLVFLDYSIVICIFIIDVIGNVVDGLMEND